MKGIRIERADGTIIEVEEATPAEISALFRMENDIQSYRPPPPHPPPKPQAFPSKGEEPQPSPLYRANSRCGDYKPSQPRDPSWNDLLVERAPEVAEDKTKRIRRGRPTVLFGKPEEEE